MPSPLDRRLPGPRGATVARGQGGADRRAIALASDAEIGVTLLPGFLGPAAPPEHSLDPWRERVVWLAHQAAASGSRPGPSIVSRADPPSRRGSP
jgi:hypothetical protein